MSPELRYWRYVYPLGCDRTVSYRDTNRRGGVCTFSLGRFGDRELETPIRRLRAAFPAFHAGLSEPGTLHWLYLVNQL